MQIFFDLLGACGRASLVLVKYLFVNTGVREPEVDGAGKCFPHFPSEAIWKTDLDQPSTLGVPKEGEISTMRYAIKHCQPIPDELQRI